RIGAKGLGYIYLSDCQVMSSGFHADSVLERIRCNNTAVINADRNTVGAGIRSGYDALADDFGIDICSDIGLQSCNRESDIRPRLSIRNAEGCRSNHSVADSVVGISLVS